ncbi:MAG: AsmA family protein [Gammaproteobacteria bacterium]|nr:MAG: AsmA family protein [Gammaproteobacteria bacterium]
MADRMVDIRRHARWLWLLLAVAVLMVAAAVITSLVDESALRAQLEQRGSAALGAELTIEGPVGLGLLPTPRLTAASVQLTSGGARVAEIEVIRLQLAVAPLFRGRVQVRRLELDGAEIRIVRDASGHYNFAIPEQTQTQAELPPTLSLTNSVIEVLNEASGARFELSELRIEAQVHEGQWTLEPVELVMFDGRGHGRGAADFSADVPTWSLEVQVDGFELEAALQALEPDARATGQMSFAAELSASGGAWEAIVDSLEGSVSLHGKTLTVQGTDLDARLADYDSTRRFGLLDVGAVLLAGPIGLVATKGTEFGRLLSAADGQTEFGEVISTWTIRGGVAEADDVAAATKENRLAARGRIDFSANRFDDLTIMLLDAQGCAVMEQAVTGPFSDPEIEEPGAIEAMLGPFTELLQRGIDQFTDEKCEVVYEGSVAHP